MNSPDDEMWSSAMTELLAAERVIPREPQESRERMRTRLTPLLALPLAPIATKNDAGSTGAAKASVATGKIVSMVLGGVIAGAVGGVTVEHHRHPPLESRAVEVSSRPASRETPVPSSPLAGVAPETLPVVATQRASAQVTGRTDHSLKDERLLIETARAAMMRGDSAGAKSLLQRHEREFPNGRLAEERESLFIQSLAHDGEIGAAKQRAESFFKRFPNSFFSDAVRAAVQ